MNTQRQFTLASNNVIFTEKTVNTIVSVLTLPKHSKARYVLVATEELSSADTFGVDLDAKKKGVVDYVSFSNKDKIADVNDDNYVPPVIRDRDTIRKDFEVYYKVFLFCRHILNLMEVNIFYSNIC